MTTPCHSCTGSGLDPAGAWQQIQGCPVDFCRTCNGSGRDLHKPPCMECGAMTLEEAGAKCICSGDKDHCHGCELWRDDGDNL